LREWAEGKKYAEPSTDSNTLSGWYGSKTMDEKLEEMDQGPEFGLFKRLRRGRSEKKAAKAEAGKA